MTAVRSILAFVALVLCASSYAARDCSFLLAQILKKPQGLHTRITTLSDLNDEGPRLANALPQFYPSDGAELRFEKLKSMPMH